MVNFKGIVAKILPANQQSEDGRDQWPSRTAFLLAAVGGAIGQGNIIRYPSQVCHLPLKELGRAESLI